ncbi:hypothetical protein O3M35_004567 [Rhynocoris fuscipes]|uniref:Nonsense-mediated mRNA decay factor SMG8 n=1 Tax=Rhynocoris fuscipes TaxID=488301 RepID=A0AAW1CLS7_9HEMI
MNFIDLPCKNYEKIFSEDDLQNKVIVISIIGNTSILDYAKIPNIFYEILKDSPTLENLENSNQYYDGSLCRIQAHYIQQEKVLLLHLIGLYDTGHLKNYFDKINEDFQTKDFLTFWNESKSDYGKYLLFLFSMSHIVIFHSIRPCVDLSLIQLFKVISYVRPKYQSNIAALLSRSSLLTDEWIYHGRLCTPRLLFLFKNCPEDILREPDDEEKLRRIKKLEHALEDQVYLVLRKSRLVKNVCNRAFFSIAPNDEFVFLQNYEPILQNLNEFDYILEKCGDPEESYLCNFENINSTQSNSDQIQSNFDELSFNDDQFKEEICEDITYQDTSSFDILEDPFSVLIENGVMEQMHLIQQTGGIYCDINLTPAFQTPEEFHFEPDFDIGPREEDICDKNNPLKDHTFKAFLMKHIVKAHSEGFFDNMGKYTNMKPFFEVPTLESWLIASNILLGDLNETKRQDESNLVTVLDKLLGTEVQFSRLRCHKVYPLAYALYQEALPNHYSKAYHEKQLKRAASILIHHAKGPSQKKFLAQLKEECEKIWKNGRQTCEVHSLFKNPCTKPLHPVANNRKSAYEGKCDHWNGIQYISTCNCGITQISRSDPFTLKEANYHFYELVGNDCGCYRLDRVIFPVFQPSTQDYRAADVNNYAGDGPPNAQIYHDAQNTRSSNTLSIINIGKLWTAEDNATPLSDQDPLVINYLNNSQQNDKHLVRQASTTEYLPGMVHLDSPPGLLPEYPSWSLVCRGPSSLYSHNLGLHDQPGFLAGSNYLLPWDVTLGEIDFLLPDLLKKDVFIKRTPIGGTIPKQSKKLQRCPKDLNSVKIFIGVEYECLRGHRFMSSGPGKILKATGNGIVKENANKITKGNMPLYLPCPCGKVIAQLMRVHIVTPKAPVHVTIDPKVRPAPNPCPIFVTGCQKPIALSQSAYWVLRLPFVYANERNCYSSPSVLKRLKYGELFGPMYGISHIE